MKVIPAVKNAFATNHLDKFNLKSLMSKLPTKTDDGNLLMTDLKTKNGSFRDLRSVGDGALIKIGKTVIHTDANGNIQGYKKPFFTSINKVIKKAINLVNEINTNLTNKDVVKQNRLELVTFSKEQAEKLSSLV